MHSHPLLGLVLALAQDPGTPAEPTLGPSPPPDRYDRQHDARLFAAFGSDDPFDGPFDPDLPEQAAPLRPIDWIVHEASPGEPAGWSELAMRFVVAPDARPLPTGRAAKMPADGALAGAFAWATTHIDSAVDEVRFVRAPGAEIVFVNGEGFIGDPERRSSLGVPVAIRKGSNTLHVAGVRDGFELELWKPMTRIVMASWALEFDFDAENPIGSDELRVPLFNASLESAGNIHVHYGRALPSGLPPRLHEWADGRYIAPLSLAEGWSYVTGPEHDLSPETRFVLAPAAVYVDGDRHGDRRLLPLDLDGPPLRFGAGEPQAWPVRVQEAESEWQGPPPILLIHETSGPADVAATALAVARHAQQRLWSRTGDIPELASDTWLEAESNEEQEWWLWWLENGLVVRFGRLDNAEPGVLVARRESGSEQEYSIRGSDAAALRLVYVVDPFFQAFDGPERSWRVP